MYSLGFRDEDVEDVGYFGDHLGDVWMSDVLIPRKMQGSHRGRCVENFFVIGRTDVAEICSGDRTLLRAIHLCTVSITERVRVWG